ncbi:MAG: asparagine synthetase B, partial [Pseudomonadota bacterium]
APPGVRWQQALRDNYGADLVEGYLVSEGILSRSAAQLFAKSEMSNANEAIVSRLALALEFWARGLVGP